ncbi:MAG: NAD(P)-dependent oxidoreductase, partial [Candidatus Cloacimonetes bacterium]|nr:NAD(P)-dependent oxidoreductase [Candidatus Cloacimonadota bacterium]
MNILITGSNGFVGSRLMWYLEEKGHTVCGIDKRDDCLIEKHLKTKKGDIREIEDLRKFNNRTIDLVI